MQTAPAMSLGVRPTAPHAVRAGLRHILFAVRPESEAVALDAYLASLRAVPNPNRVATGALSEAAQRGQRLFEDAAVGCARCHPAPLFTDRQSHAVGTQHRPGTSEDRFDTPTLVECWRTAPYLHDGSAASLVDIMTTRNAGDRHGMTSQLTAEQIGDLVAYVRSL